MKKVLFFIAFLVGFSGAFAQVATVTLGLNKTYAEYNTDVTVGSGATSYFVIKGEQHEPCTQNFVIHLDSISGGAHATTVKLYGTNFGNYTQIGSTITWIASTADTTIYFANATATRYRDYKLEVVNASGDVTKIDYWKFKIWVE